MNGEAAKLQSATWTDEEKSGNEFIFVVDVCSNLQDITGAECKGNARSQHHLLKWITLQTKIQTEFFKPAEGRLSSQFKTFFVNLSSTLANQQMYNAV